MGSVLGQPLEEAISYDARGYLAQAQTTAGHNEYTYGPAGLPLSARDLFGTRSLARGAEAVQIGALEYDFDALGRAIRKGDAQIDYGPTGRPSSVRRGSESWSYRYDESGTRLLRAKDGGEQVGYVADGMLLESGFLEPIRVGGLIVGALDGEVFKPLVADARGVLLGDGQGASLPASPYGVRDRRPTVSQLVDFAGSGFDDVLQTVGIGARDYDPYTGQWLTGDDHFLEEPSAGVGRATEYNLVSYAANNPSSYIDVTGRVCEGAIGNRTCRSFLPNPVQEKFNAMISARRSGASAAESSIVGEQAYAAATRKHEVAGAITLGTGLFLAAPLVVPAAGAMSPLAGAAAANGIASAGGGIAGTLVAGGSLEDSLIGAGAGLLAGIALGASGVAAFSPAISEGLSGFIGNLGGQIYGKFQLRQSLELRWGSAVFSGFGAAAGIAGFGREFIELNLATGLTTGVFAGIGSGIGGAMGDEIDQYVSGVK
jgi:RHS repeat-associated protein